MEEPILIEEDIQPDLSQNSDKIVLHDENGKFVKGHPKVGGKQLGSISLTTVIKRKLKELEPDGKREAIEVLADNIIQDSLDGHDIRRTLWSYIDGMPRQKIGLEGGEEGSAIALKIVNYDDRGDVQTPSLSDKSPEGV
jgi:hypothetical protein